VGDVAFIEAARPVTYVNDGHEEWLVLHVMRALKSAHQGRHVARIQSQRSVADEATQWRGSFWIARGSSGIARYRRLPNQTRPRSYIRRLDFSARG
jgi:hypothetical protein